MLSHLVALPPYTEAEFPEYAHGYRRPCMSGIKKCELFALPKTFCLVDSSFCFCNEGHLFIAVTNPHVLYESSRSMKKYIHILTNVHDTSFSHSSTFHILTQVISPIFENVPQHKIYFTFLTKKVIRISEKFLHLRTENIFHL